MKNIVLLLLLFVSCSEKPTPAPDNDFADRLLIFLTSQADGQTVELPELYGQAVQHIPESADENLILAEKLKVRGFTVTKTERRDMQLSGQRIIMLTLEKEKCRCEVSKVYYTTANISEYRVTERIRCTNNK